MSGIRALGQQRHRLPDLGRQEALRALPARFAQPRRPFAPHRYRHRGHPRRRRAGPFAVGKHVQERQFGFGHEIQRFAEQRLGLGGKAGDQVGADRDPGPQRPRPRDRRRRIGAQMAALHALQDQVAARLQRQVQMRHQPRLLAQQPPEVVIDRRGIQRRQPQPLQLGHQGEQPPHQLAQSRRPRQVGAVRGDVDAGQHHLLVPRLDQGANLRHHRADRHAAVGAAAERDDAERAAMVAALLHLHEGPRPAGEFGDQMRRRLARRHDVGHRARGARRPAFRPQLVRVAQHAVHAGQLRPRRRIDLRRAAGDHDARTWPLARRATDRLARLALRLGRHRAGVDDHRVGQSGGVAAHHLALVGVQPAAEGEDLDAHAG